MCPADNFTVTALFLFPLVAVLGKLPTLQYVLVYFGVYYLVTSTVGGNIIVQLLRRNQVEAVGQGNHTVSQNMSSKNTGKFTVNKSAKAPHSFKSSASVDPKSLADASLLTKLVPGSFTANRASNTNTKPNAGSMVGNRVLPPINV